MPFFALICEVEEPNWIPFGSRHVLSGTAAAQGPFASAAEGERCIAEQQGGSAATWPWRSVRLVDAANAEQAIESRFERTEQYAVIADRIGRQEVNPRFDIWWQIVD